MGILGRLQFRAVPSRHIVRTRPAPRAAVALARLAVALGLVAVLAIAVGTGTAIAAAVETPSSRSVGAEREATKGAAVVAPVTANAVTANPYGLEALWRGGDAIARGTLVLLVLMSIGSWYVILAKLYEQRRFARHRDAAEAQFFRAASIESGIASLGAGSPFRFIAERALAAHGERTGMRRRVEAEEWLALSMERAVAAVQRRMQRGLALLATTGSTAPFVGLFGTVWGIYRALTAIGIAGQASIDRVAGPVGEALIMTAVGIAVAVPAVLGYNVLVQRNKAAMEDLRSFADDLHAVLQGGGAAGVPT